MDFYTSVNVSGNYIFVRGYEDGKRVSRQIEWSPTVYLRDRQISPTDETSWRNIDGNPVRPWKINTIKEAREYIKQNENVDGLEIYGNLNFATAWIQENFPDEIGFDAKCIHVGYIDIETDNVNGYSEAIDATEQITAITLWSSVSKKFFVYGCGEFKSDDPEVRYFKFDTEVKMLEQFLRDWEYLDFDIVTGWNIKIYDFPYIINRLTRLFGKDGAKKLSPIGYVREKREHQFHREQLVYEIAGVAQLDLLMLYRKNVSTPKESFRLDSIAESELGERKIDYSEVGDLGALHRTNYQKFILYNIHDVRLVQKLEEKLRLIELQMVVAYDAKINFEDVFSPNKMLDNRIMNHLLSKKMVVPQRSLSFGGESEASEGAYVKEPVVGRHNWVVSFDVTSLYPTIMMSLNMGPETKIPMHQTSHKFGGMNAERMLKGDFDAQFLIDNNLTLAANGVCYTRSKKSFFKEVLEDLFAKRVAYKNRAQTAKKALVKLEQQEETPLLLEERAKYKQEAIKFDLYQQATKISLNSLFGVMGSTWFRFFDRDNFEAVTITGQFAIQYIAREINIFFNNFFKTTDIDYILYIDTDSVYLAMESVVERYKKAMANGNKPQPTTEEIVDFLDSFAQAKIEPAIDAGFTKMLGVINGTTHFKMKRESIAINGSWNAKKRYILSVLDNEGVRYSTPELKYIGVEFAKATSPKYCRDNMKEAARIYLRGDKDEFYEFVAKVKEGFYKLNPEEIAAPRGVSDLVKYADQQTIYKSGTPIQVKGALVHNHLIDKLDLGMRYQKIKNGDKLKYVYLKSNHITKSNVISFANVLPKEFGLHEFVDYDSQYESSFEKPLKLIVEAARWTLQPITTLEDLFA